MLKSRICACVLFLYAVCASGQELTGVRDSAILRLARQAELWPLEKVHVTTDRASYMPGDRIWLRAHLADADNRPSRISRYVYVELVSPGGELMRRIMLRPDTLGVFAGHIDLQEALPEGDYTLRSYTQYMQNSGEESFFRKTLRVLDPYAKRKDTPADKKPDFDVSLLPEGGYLVPGRACRVGVKVLGEDGMGLNVSGRVLNSKGEEVAQIANLHRGMGYFIIKPQAGEKYVAVCTADGGRQKRFPLPMANPAARVIQLQQFKSTLNVSLLRGPEAADEEMWLLVHQAGRPLACMEWEKDRTFYSFTTATFPSGIVAFMLIDKDVNILSERLFFNLGKDVRLSLDGGAEKGLYAGRERVRASFSLPPGALESASGASLAVSVTDSHASAPDSLNSLAATLLLSSELNGYVEAPAEYFTPRGEPFVDALMLTQAWRRYDIPAVLKGACTTPKVLPEKAQILSGHAEGYLFNRMAGGRVSLYATLDTLVSVNYAPLAKDGRFIFATEFPEGTEITVQTQTGKGQSGNILMVDEKTYPGTVKAALPQEREAIVPDADMEQAFDEYIRQHGLQETLLDAATVQASLQKKPSESIWYSEMNSTRPLTAEDIEKMNYTNILSVFLNTPGVTVRHNANGNYVSTTRSEMPALPVIDDVVMPEYDIMTMSPRDIESMFVIKDYTSQFGYYPGYSGAIVIKTAKGFVQNLKKNDNIVRVRPLGYQRPAEFWAPRYITQKQKDSPEADLRTTIYWNPSVSFDASGQARFEFWTADKDTEYQIVGEGLSRDGKVLELHSTIKIETE